MAWWQAQPVLAAGALAHLLAGLAFVVAMAVDDRTLLGLNVWIKPQKFAFSLAIFLATMAWIASAHEMPGRVRTIFAGVLVLVGVIEIALIAMQAGRGVTSHFNVGTRFDSTVYATMGVAIAVATLVVFIIACTPLRADVRGVGLRWGIRLGEAVFLLGCAWGAFMAPRTGHSVGGSDGGSGLPYVNWSTTHGDLRVAHFVLLHGLQALPLAGLIVDRLSPALDARRWIVAALAAAMLALAAWAARMALMGVPLVRG